MKDANTEVKFDAPLRMKLREVRQARVETPLKCILKLSSGFDETKRKALADTGVQVLTVMKELVTIEGSPEAIRRVAGYEFVHSISLSQTRFPPEKR